MKELENIGVKIEKSSHVTGVTKNSAGLFDVSMESKGNSSVIKDNNIALFAIGDRQILKLVWIKPELRFLQKVIFRLMNTKIQPKRTFMLSGTSVECTS